MSVNRRGVVFIRDLWGNFSLFRLNLVLSCTQTNTCVTSCLLFQTVTLRSRQVSLLQSVKAPKCVWERACVIFYDFWFLAAEQKQTPPSPLSKKKSLTIPHRSHTFLEFPPHPSPESEIKLIYFQMIKRCQFDLREIGESRLSSRSCWQLCDPRQKGAGSPQSLITFTAFPNQGPPAPRPPCEQLLSVAFSPVQADARPPRSTCRDRWTLSLTTGCPNPLLPSGTPPTEVRTTRRQCPPGFLLPSLPLSLFIPFRLPSCYPNLVFWFFFYYDYNCRLWWPACLPVLGDWSFTPPPPLPSLLSRSQSASWCFDLVSSVGGCHWFKSPLHFWSASLHLDITVP